MNWLWRWRVKRELKLWTNYVLSKPSQFFNGCSPCPFAKKAWAKKEVKVVFGDPHKIDYYMDNWTNEYQLLIQVFRNKKHFSQLEWVCEINNRRHRKNDLVAMAFVPGVGVETGQPDEEMEDWPHLIEEPYAMVFIQKLSELKKASNTLNRRGYYKNCTPQFNKYVHERGKHDSRKQEEGNEEDHRKTRREEEGWQKDDGCNATYEEEKEKVILWL